MLIMSSTVSEQSGFEQLKIFRISTVKYITWIALDRPSGFPWLSGSILHE